MTRKALIIGVTGNFGGAVARALAARGWRIAALHRNPAKVAESVAVPGLTWVEGDAMSEADYVAAAKDADVIVHGANPPYYRNWGDLVVPMTRNAIAAARASGARLLVPGNVYNYGPDVGHHIVEDAPQSPTSSKGKVRVQMELALKAAAAHGVRTIVLRAGDFFGDEGSNWFSDALVTPGKTVSKIAYPGVVGVPHAWAFLPDLGETAARLLEREADLGPYEVFHFRGHKLERGIEMAEAVRRVIGRPDMKIGAFPWYAVGLARPFVPLFRELWEMRYLWQREVTLDNAKLVAFLGEEPHTPLDEAVRYTLAELGCLAASEPAHAGSAVAA